MINVLRALAWRARGRYNPQEPVREESVQKRQRRIQNRAKWEVWKYNSFGPGREVFGKDHTYQIIDSGELSREPLFLNDPDNIAAMASIIAEMEGHRDIWLRMHSSAYPTSQQETLDLVARREDTAINRVVEYVVPDNLKPQQYVERYYEEKGSTTMFGDPVMIPVIRVVKPDVPRYRENHRKKFREMLDKLKQHNAR